ncbi:pyrimidine nucleoside transporter NupC [Aerococcus urinaehominis]|uniref:Pyrimidine nucleoside transporter NupC n=1 Tax=Aerococcus urinaehominis TaxID=128944 RepID=A0A0X8FL63_9LACT|nr:nucleoside transporter C-terminal domain-containing protein [Aerococcus urinaehominis]AMB99320.1 pyrimidine nucleoside transporter NupC [Aerococcus urinaehominis]SDM20232.1 nucleoside transport protein [Aerococcus urinaehominis]
MGTIRGIIDLIVIFLIAWLFSNNRQDVLTKKGKNILVMLVLQLIICFLCLKTTVGIQVMGSISNFFGWLIGQSQAGINFVFGGLEMGAGGVFFFNVLLPLVFLSALIAILDYIKVMPFLMKWIGIGVNKITGMGQLEGQLAISTLILGQPAGYIPIQEQLKQISGKRLFTLTMSATSTVGMSMLAAYMELIPGQFVVVAVLLNIFSPFIITAIMNPYDAEEDQIEHAAATGAPANLALTTPNAASEDKPSLFDAISDAISQGFNLALIIAAMLIGFVSIIAFLNNILSALIGITFTQILGYIFSPLALAIGVPMADMVEAGSIMATKLLSSEFVAISEMLSFGNNITEKTIAMMSAYAISFANFGTVGIVTGALKSIDAKQAKVFSGFSMKMMLGATLSAVLTACIVGFFY